jgi:hypothetical protein
VVLVLDFMQGSRWESSARKHVAATQIRDMQESSVPVIDVVVGMPVVKHVGPLVCTYLEGHGILCTVRSVGRLWKP